MRDLAILIPTLGRAEKLAALVENIHETTESSHGIYLIIERTDAESLAVARQLNAVSVIGKFGSCAAAVNAGYRGSWEPYFAIANDDVHFHEGWDTTALAHLDEDHHIVGVNDGSGDCKCFQLVRRSYIAEHSGVYDQPNTVYHQYRSQCCDTEFAHYAMLRGVWTEAPGAVIEHEHWRFGKADDPDHPNYVRARATNAADLDEYNRRREQWDPEHRTPSCVLAGSVA